MCRSIRCGPIGGMKMENDNDEQLIQSWILYQDADDKVTKEKHWWAEKKMFDLVDKQPEIGWELIKKISECELSDRAFGCLAAGPLEDLLADHGERFIERVVTRARQNPRFNLLLGGVWQNDMPDVIWEQIKKIRNSVW